MKVNITQRLQGDPSLLDLLKRIAYQVNTLSEGFISAKYTAQSDPPTTGKWSQGDEVANHSPVEQGVDGSKYIVRSWICTESGEPGTWCESRTLTGN